MPFPRDPTQLPFTPATNLPYLESRLMKYLPFLFALATALCWGLYGPTLGRARIHDPEASVFKAYLGIGAAYLVIAVGGAAIIMALGGRDKWEYTPSIGWGFAAGALGALGALFLTFAMFTGGHKIPHAVMPIVFGGAVTVAALSNVISSKGALTGGPLLWIGIVGMGLSAVVIAANTPHGHPPKPAHAPVTTPETSSQENVSPPVDH